MILEWVFSLFLIQFLIWSSTTKGPWKIDSSGVALSYKDFGCFFLSIWIKVISILSNLHWGVWETFPVYLYSSSVCMWVWLYTRGAAAAASVLHWCIIIHHGWRSGRFHIWFFHVHKSHRHKNDMLLHFCPFAYFVLSKFILVALCSSFPPISPSDLLSLLLPFTCPFVFTEYSQCYQQARTDIHTQQIWNFNDQHRWWN